MPGDAPRGRAEASPEVELGAVARRSPSRGRSLERSRGGSPSCGRSWSGRAEALPVVGSGPGAVARSIPMLWGVAVNGQVVDTKEIQNNAALAVDRGDCTSTAHVSPPHPPTRGRSERTPPQPPLAHLDRRAQRAPNPTSRRMATRGRR